MSWGCCTPDGRCQRAHGCPAGGACHSQPGCADTRCPGHPGPAKPQPGAHRVDLRRVQLCAAPKRQADCSVIEQVVSGFAKGLLILEAILGLIFVLLLLTGHKADNPPTQTQTKTPKVTT